MRTLFTLFLTFLISHIVLSQRPYYYPKYTNRLYINLLESKNAVIVNYDYDKSQLTVGNNMVPPNHVVENKIKEKFHHLGVNIDVMVIQNKYNSINNCKLSNLLIEHNIESIITLDFKLTENHKFSYFNVIEPMQSANGISEHHPYCNEIIDFGFLPEMTISRFSRDSLLFEKKDRYFIYGDGYESVLKRFKKSIDRFSSKDIETRNTFIVDKVKTGKIINNLPDNLNSSTIYMPYHEEIYAVDAPKGLLNSIGIKLYVGQVNKQVKKDKKNIKKCKKSDLNINFYSIYNGLSDNDTIGYQLLYFDTYYKINDRVDSLRHIYNGNIESVTLGGFNRVRGKQRHLGTKEDVVNCDWYDIPKYRYYYLKSIETGDIFLVDYNTSNNNEIDIESTKSLEQYLDFIIK